MMEYYEEYYKKPHFHTTNSIYCLDIEVSSFWIDKDKNIISYDKNIPDEFYNSCDKGSCVYIWQFSIEDNIYYGREFNDLYKFIIDINNDILRETEKSNMIIYSHNLSYEFCFLQNLPFEWDNVFARNIRKPMKATTKENITFKCSYMLTNLSLASWGKQLGIPKKVGDLDYTALKTPLSKLNEKELSYCEYDLKIMIAGLKKYRTKYEKLSKIPLTATGEVRKVVNELYVNNYTYKRHITKLQPKNVEMWKIFKACFGGGDTHAHVVNARKNIKSVSHIDETSAYPSMIVRKKFPNSQFIKVKEDIKMDFERYSYIIGLKMENVKLKGTLSYISKGRCKIVKNSSEDNGRIISADKLILYVTELDYQMIKKLYKFNETIISLYRSRKTYLDKTYIEYVLQLFTDKTTLKNVKFYEDLYQQQKARLNSLYGMMVTDIVQPMIEYKNHEWVSILPVENDIMNNLSDVQNKIYKNTLAFQYGIWVTSYSRYELWNAILKISEYDEQTGKHNNDVCYFDTDSIFYKNGEKYKSLINELNNKIIEETKKACDFHNIDYSAFMPVAPNGKKSILGTWTYEPEAELFRTLGAKKYVTIEEGEMKLTCSGVPKDAVKSLSCIDDFEDGYKFTNEDCHKGLSHYIDGDNYKGKMPDGYYLNQPFGLNIRNVGYKVGLTADFKKLIQTLQERGYI